MSVSLYTCTNETDDPRCRDTDETTHDSFVSKEKCELRCKLKSLWFENLVDIKKFIYEKFVNIPNSKKTMEIEFKVTSYYASKDALVSWKIEKFDDSDFYQVSRVGMVFTVGRDDNWTTTIESFYYDDDEPYDRARDVLFPDDMFSFCKLFAFALVPDGERLLHFILTDKHKIPIQTSEGKLLVPSSPLLIATRLYTFYENKGFTQRRCTEDDWECHNMLEFQSKMERRRKYVRDVGANVLFKYQSLSCFFNPGFHSAIAKKTIGEVCQHILNGDCFVPNLKEIVRVPENDLKAFGSLLKEHMIRLRIYENEWDIFYLDVPRNSIQMNIFENITINTWETSVENDVANDVANDVKIKTVVQRFKNIKFDDVKDHVAFLFKFFTQFKTEFPNAETFVLNTYGWDGQNKYLMEIKKDKEISFEHYDDDDDDDDVDDQTAPEAGFYLEDSSKKIDNNFTSEQNLNELRKLCAKINVSAEALIDASTAVFNHIVEKGRLD